MMDLYMNRKDELKKKDKDLDDNSLPFPFWAKWVCAKWNKSIVPRQVHESTTVWGEKFKYCDN